MSVCTIAADTNQTTTVTDLVNNSAKNRDRVEMMGVVETMVNRPIAC